MVRRKITMAENFKIAITGGIGSGKSTVSEIIKSAGYTVISCDQINAELYKNRKTLKGLKKIFPTAIKGFFKLVADKKEIAKIAFSDQKKYKALNDYLIPKIKENLFARLKTENGLVFAEVPLLYESNLKNDFDGVIVVTRNKDQRIKSVMTRSALTEEDVISRINMQIDYDTLSISDEKVIVNDGNIDDLTEKIQNILNELKKEYAL